MMKLFATTALLSCVIATSSFARNAGDPTETHFAFADTAKGYELNIRGQLVDSVAITNLTNAKTHYDNSMSVRLFANGKFTDAFLFNTRVKISTDYTNRYINFNFYNPDEGIPFNKQSEHKRTWDLFAANVSYSLKPSSGTMAVTVVICAGWVPRQVMWAKPTGV